MRVLMKRSIVENFRPLDAGKVYELLPKHARRLVRLGKAEPLDTKRGAVASRE